MLHDPTKEWCPKLKLHYLLDVGFTKAPCVPAHGPRESVASNGIKRGNGNLSMFCLFPLNFPLEGTCHWHIWLAEDIHRSSWKFQFQPESIGDCLDLAMLLLDKFGFVIFVDSGMCSLKVPANCNHSCNLIYYIDIVGYQSHAVRE